VLTADRDGALLFVNGERYEVHPYPVQEIDPTGAGDVFAATFLIQYQRDGDPWQAAAAAACAGALAVEGEGWSAVADRATLDATLADSQRHTYGRPAGTAVGGAAGLQGPRPPRVPPEQTPPAGPQPQRASDRAPRARLDPSRATDRAPGPATAGVA